MLGALLAPAAAAACGPPGRPIVAEVYYDAIGDDTGFEFVEILNPTGADWPLAGLRLDAGDGAGPGRWTARWTGAAGDTVRAHARFVIGGARVSPPPDAVATLDLQNGPDGMRLVWPDGATEVVGWGALAYPEYFCGAPAADAPAGESLARVPDEAETGSNAGDFRPAAPSPGAANVHARDLALLPGALALAPEQPAAGGAARLAAGVVNRGTAAVAAGEAQLVAGGPLLAAPAAAALPALAPGESLRVALPLAALVAGRAAIRVRVALAGDEAPANDADSLPARVGPGPLALTEIQFHPAAREGEWVEVRNAGGAPLPLEGFLLGDRGGARGAIAPGPPLPPDSLAVLAQDPAALALAFPALDPRWVRAVSPWASLNNSADSGGVADVVELRDEGGVADALVPYAAAGVPAGCTLEWDGQAWWPSDAPGGTPLAPPRRAVAGEARFTAAPRRLAAGGGSVRFAWRLPWPRARVALELYDLEGHAAARLADEFPCAAEGERQASLAGLAPGLYLAVLRARPESGPGTLTRVTPLRLVGPPR